MGGGFGCEFVWLVWWFGLLFLCFVFEALVAGLERACLVCLGFVGFELLIWVCGFGGLGFGVGFLFWFVFGG